MKIRIEIDQTAEREIIIRTPAIDDEVLKIQSALERVSSTGEIALKNGSGEIFVRHSEICFFEVNGEHTYAHTAKECYTTPMRLFELEGILPGTFCRASKSVLLNTMKVRSLTRSPTGVGEASFSGSEKRTFISRMYYKSVRDVIEEVRLNK